MYLLGLLFGDEYIRSVRIKYRWKNPTMLLE